MLKKLVIVHVCVLVLEGDFEAEINFDLRNEEFWLISLYYNMYYYYNII